MNQNYQQLKQITQKSLQACYLDGKVVASPTHFSDFWARDTFWALPGMLEIGDYQEAKNCLEYFLSFQRKDGKIPRKISLDLNAIKYLTGKKLKRKKPRPTYHGLIKPFYAKDSELLLINAFTQYIKKTQDTEFLQKNFSKLQKAIGWHIKTEKSGLISEYFLGNWMDTVFKFGPVLYSNVLYFQALKQMSVLARILKNKKMEIKYLKLAVKTQDVIQDRFWNREFFIDETRKNKEKTFDLAGNVLAVIFNVGEEDQKNLVMKKLKEYFLKYGAFVPAVPTGHRWWKINPVVRLLGIADYHTSTSWSWIDAFLIKTFYENGEVELAEKMLQEIENVIMKNQEMGETYFVGGEVYKKRFWKSASPFAWSSGVLLSVLGEVDY